MTHSHDDRVAEHQPGMCTAYGCPLRGTRSDSTTGGDWWCGLHHGREFGAMQAITSAINRRRWLADAITLMATVVPAVPGSRDRYEKAQKLLRDNGRPDLCLQVNSENIRRWLNRVEPELENQVLAEVEAPMQQPLGEKDTWQKASEILPDWA
jgi:beta-phosphoglucomutase-like phosphatase (HAD superfamily)